MSYLAIAQQCRDYSRSKGFVATTWDEANIRLNAIQREIGELEQAIKDNDRAQQALESADVAAYALLMLIDLGCENWHIRERIHGGPHAHSSPADKVSPLRKHADNAFEHWRRGERGDFLVCLELLIAMLVDVRTRCLQLSNHLHHDIQRKLALNASRPPCHGGKDPRS